MSSESSQLALMFFTGWAQILLYGCNIILFGTGVFLLHRQRGWNRDNVVPMLYTIILFALATMLAGAETTLIVARLHQIIDKALQVESSTTTPVSWTTGGINLNACNTIVYVGLLLIDLVAFFILVHRCYALYSRSLRVVAIPIALVLAEIGVYISAIPSIVKQSSVYTEEIDQKLLHLGIAAQTLNIVANGLLTFLIARKIWDYRKRMNQLIGQDAPYIQRKYNAFIAMTVESGLIIPVSLVLWIVCTHYKVVIAGPIEACLPQLIALAPILITVRTGLGLAVEERHVTILADSTEPDVELQTSPPLTVSVTVSRIRAVSPSEALSKGSDVDSELEAEQTRKAERYVS